MKGFRAPAKRKRTAGADVVAVVANCVNILLTNPIWVVVTQMQTHKKANKQQIPQGLTCALDKPLEATTAENAPYKTDNEERVSDHCEERGALGSRLPSMANAKARVAGAGAILRPVSTGTQVVIRRARSVAQAAWTRPALQLSSWTCIGPRRRNNISTSTVTSEEIITSTGGGSESTSLLTETTTETTETVTSEAVSEVVQSSVSVAVDAVDLVDDKGDSDDDIVDHHGDEDRMTDVELWQQLESELYRKREGEEDDIAKEMAESTIAEEVGGVAGDVLSETKEVHRFYPPGKIMHILFSSSEEAVRGEEPNDDVTDGEAQSSLGIFLTPRSLYDKLRLSKMMINDHYMPIYRRNIEQLIAKLEKDSSDQIGCVRSS
ncbi:uncharacterized protein [Zea mays]|nr:uncharacterized protein LOC103642717 [Zea mays]|eukprot:XP_008664146.1 uncharacterized protein LOC103642717 [Zea mays]